MLVEWKEFIDVFLDMNSQINLSAIRDEEGVYHKHILDSLELLKIVDLENTKTIADVGTGGGFPLLPLAKVLGNSISLTGIDARRKKTIAINTMIQKLGLENCTTIWSRVEEHQKKYDLVTARAVAYADKILPWCLSLCKPAGRICLYKKKDATEREVLLSLIKKEGLSLEQEHSYSLFDGDIQRVIYVIGV